MVHVQKRIYNLCESPRHWVDLRSTLGLGGEAISRGSNFALWASRSAKRDIFAQSGREGEVKERSEHEAKRKRSEGEKGEGESERRLAPVTKLSMRLLNSTSLIRSIRAWDPWVPWVPWHPRVPWEPKGPM